MSSSRSIAAMGSLPQNSSLSRAGTGVSWTMVARVRSLDFILTFLSREDSMRIARGQRLGSPQYTIGAGPPAIPQPVESAAWTHRISYQLSAISYQLSAISYQLSAISYQLSAISYQKRPIGFRRFKPSADG